MDESYLMLGHVLGAPIGVLLSIYVQRKRHERLWQLLEPVLRSRGPLDLRALADEVGMHGFFAHQRVAQAVYREGRARRVTMIPAPAGTPWLQRRSRAKFHLAA